MVRALHTLALLGGAHYRTHGQRRAPMGARFWQRRHLTRTGPPQDIVLVVYLAGEEAVRKKKRHTIDPGSSPALSLLEARKQK